MLTQIRNIRKTILQTQMPLTILTTCVSISGHEAPTCHPRSFVPSSPLYTSQPGIQIETLEMITNSSHGSNPGSFIVMMKIPSYQQTMLTSSSILFQEFQNYQANIETHSLIFETDKTAISPPPYPKPGVSGNLLFQFLMICTTIMKLHKYVPTDVRK